MKKRAVKLSGLRLLLTVLSIFVASEAHAAVKYWIGASGGSFGSNSNWSTTSGGANDTTAPGSSDIATFDGGDVDNCAIDGNVNVAGIDIKSGYTGIITQNNSYTITVGSSNWVQADGTFAGGNSTININGAFTQSDGTFTATTATTFISGNFTHTNGGTFSHNNGSITADIDSSRTWDVNSSETFNNFTINAPSGHGLTVSAGDTFTLNGTTNFINGFFSGSTSFLEVKGDATVTSTYDTASVPIHFTGTGAQKLNLTGATDKLDGHIVVNKSGGTLTLESDLNMDNNSSDFELRAGTFDTAGYTLTTSDIFYQSGGILTSGASRLDLDELNLTGGTFNASTGTTSISRKFTQTGGTFNHNNGMMLIDIDSSYTWDFVNSQTFYNVTMSTPSGHGLTISAGDTFTVNGSFALGNGFFAGATAFLEVKADATVESTHDNTNIPIHFTGTGAQKFNLAGASTLYDGNIVINKSGGTLTLESDYTAGTDFILLAGTFDPAGYALTVSDDYTQGGGTLSAASGTLDLTKFTLTGGTFNCSSGTTSVSQTFTHTAGGTFNHNNSTFTADLTSTYTWDVNGSETFNNFVLNNPASHALTMSSGDTFTINGTTTITNGYFSGTSAYIEAKGHVTIESGADSSSTPLFFTGGANQNFNLTGATALFDANLVIDKSGGTVTLQSDLIMNTSSRDFELRAGTFDPAGYAVTNTGTYQQLGGTFSAGAGTLDFESFKLVGGTFNASSGTTSISNTFTHTVGGTFNHNNGTLLADITSNRTWDVNASETFNNFTLNPTSGYALTISTGDTFTVNSTLSIPNGYLSGGFLEVKGDVTFAAGADTGSTTPLVFTGSSNQALNLTGAEANHDSPIVINKSGGTVTLQSAMTLNAGGQDLTLLGGTLDMASYNLTVADDTTIGGGVFTGGSGATHDLYDLTINGGTYTATSGETQISAVLSQLGGTFNHGSGQVTFDASSVTHDVNTSITFNKLKINGTNGQTKTLSAGDTFVVLSDATFTESRFTAGTVEVQGNFFVASTYDTAGTTTFNFTGSGNQIFDLTGATALIDGDVNVNKSGGQIDLLSDFTLNAANQDLIIQEGTLDLNGKTLTVNGTSGTLIVETGGNLQLQGGETITANTNYPQLDSGSKVTYDGSSTYTIKDYTYHHVTTAGAGTYSMNAGETFGGNLTITSGTFDLNGQNLTVNGTFSNDGTIKLQGGETTVSLTMDTNSGTAEYSGTGTYNTLKLGNTYYHLNINGAGTFKHGATLDVNGNLTISAGTLDSNGQNITLAGNWTNNATYTHNNNTVTFDGTNQTLSGATTFNNVTKTTSSAATLTFPTANTITIAGSSTFHGASGNLLSLRSSSSGTRSDVDFQGATRSLKYLDVKDNNNLNGTTVVCNSACTNSGNNLGWDFTPPTVQFSTASSNGAESTSPTLTAQLSAAMLVDATASYAVTGTATGGGVDYTLANGTITIPAGSTSATLSPTIVNDTHDEAGETVIVTLSSPTNSTIGATNAQTYTINDDDDPPTVQFSATSSNGAESVASPSLTVSLSATSGQNVTVDYALSGTATGSGTDYTLASGTLTITAGNSSGTITPTIVNDTHDEAGETVIVTISNPGNATLAANTQHTYTINDDDAAPTVQFSATSSNGAESVAAPTLTVSLSATSGQNVTVDYALSGTATGSGTDYTLANGTLTITAGNPSGTITPTIVNDALDEAGETVIVTISNPSNATLAANTQHTYTINDNDDTPSLSVDDVTVTETEGNVTATFTATLSAASGQTVTVDYATANGTAASGADYTAVSATTLTFNPGDTTKTFNVTVLGDTTDENNETYTVNLSNASNATISDSSGTGTITDNDAAPSLAVNDVTVTETEGNVTATFTATLSAASGKTVTVDWSTANGTAASGSDYVAVSATTLTFNAGDTTKTFNVTVSGDSLDEDNETYTTNLANASNATISDAAGTGTITDNDATPTLAFTASSSNGAESATSPGLQLTLSAVSGRNVTVDYAATGGTATGSGTDYTLANGTATVTAGSTTTNISLSVINDDQDESDETAQVTISNPVNATLGATTVHAYTIQDNDSAGVTVTPSGGSVVLTEASVTDTYTVVLTSQPTANVTITPSPNSQQTVNPTSLTFTSANWNVAQTVTVTAVNDSVAEGNHTGSITHTAASSDSIYNGFSVAAVTPAITDNDTAGVSVSESGGSTATDEDLGSDSYTVILTSQPTANVTVTPSFNSQITVTPATLTFTTANWNTAQTLTVTGRDDDRIEGTHTAAITHAAASSDANYSAITIGGVTVSLTDDDSAGVTLLQSGNSTSVSEGGLTGDTYTMSLTSEPSASVTIAVSHDTQITVTPTTLTFTASNWNTPQTLTVAAVDDLNEDTTANSTITHSVSASADSNYPTTLTIASIVVAITDDDTDSDDDDDDDDDEDDDNAGGSSETDNSAPTVSAGADSHAVSSTGVVLSGQASDPDGDSLTYQWQQILTDACSVPVTLTNATTLTPSFTVPETGTCFAFTLTVNDGSLTTEDSVTITSLKREVAATQGATIESLVIAANGSNLVTAKQGESSNGESHIEIALGDGYKALLQSLDGVSILIDDRIIVSDPNHDNSTGRVITIDLSATESKTINLTANHLEMRPGLDVAYGETEGDLFGTSVALSDVDGDGTAEILILATGAGYGTITVVDQTTLAVLSEIHGSAAENLSSKLMVSGNLNGLSGDEILIGVNLAASGSLSRSLSRYVDSGNTPLSAFNGLIGADLPAIVDFGTDEPDFILDTNADISLAAKGDLNGDAIDDLVMGSDSDGEIFVYLGSNALGTSQTDMSVKCAVSGMESTTLTSLAVEDVTGDGLADILVGFPQASSGNGSIHVITGRSEWPDEDCTLDFIVVIRGTSAQQIGTWIITGDYDGDGVSDIITSENSSGGSTVITVSALQTSGTTASSADSALGEGGVAGCSLNYGSKSIRDSISTESKVIALLIFTCLYWMRRKQHAS